MNLKDRLEKNRTLRIRVRVGHPRTGFSPAAGVGPSRKKVRIQKGSDHSAMKRVRGPHRRSPTRPRRWAKSGGRSSEKEMRTKNRVTKDERRLDPKGRKNRFINARGDCSQRKGIGEMRPEMHRSKKRGEQRGKEDGQIGKEYSEVVRMG